jgi:hypothetical protein
MKNLFGRPLVITLLLGTVLSQPAGAEGLTGNAEMDALIAQVGKAATCAIAQQAASGGGGAMSGIISAFCAQPPQMANTAVPMTAMGGGSAAGGGLLSQAGIGQIAGQFVQQIMQQAMSGGGGGGSGGKETGGGTVGGGIVDDNIAGLPIIIGGGFTVNNGVRTNPPNVLSTINPRDNGLSAGVITRNPLNSTAGVVNNARNFSGQADSRQVNTVQLQAVRNLVVDNDWQNRTGGVRLASGELAAPSGVSLGAFGEQGTGVMLASSASGGSSAGIAANAAMAANLNPVLEMFNQGYDDAMAGKVMNQVFADDADYKRGYSQGRIAAGRAVV